MANNTTRLIEFMARVWSAGDVGAVDELLGPQYTIYSDPGDPWDGQTLSVSAFKERLIASRAPFPDLTFDIDDTVSAGDRVALSWTMRGTQLGALGGRPPSGRSFAVRGITIYHFSDGRIIGHQQVVDRLSVAQQLGLFG
ncbi:MAG: ester cyclase [Gemmatimonadaceae bacterium]|nr:ester cyclase [Gemmatimonadaceae bacterium]